MKKISDFLNKKPAQPAAELSNRDNIILLLSVIKLHYLQYSRLAQKINFETLSKKSGQRPEDVKKAVETLAALGWASCEEEALLSIEDDAFRQYNVTLKSAKPILRAQRKAVYEKSDKPRLPRVKVANNPELIKDSGNRCGHNPNNKPQFLLPEGDKKRPPVIALLFFKISNYYSSPAFLPLLNSANGSKRQQRSERREACILLTGALLSRCDLLSMRVGMPVSDNEFCGIRLKKLAEIAGISFSRAVRASRDMVKAKLLNVVQRSEKQDDETYIGFPAIRVISKKLFEAFGLSEALKEAREKLHRRKVAKKHDETKSKMPLTLKELMDEVGVKASAIKAATDASSQQIAFSMMSDILE